MNYSNWLNCEETAVMLKTQLGFLTHAMIDSYIVSNNINILIPILFDLSVWKVADGIYNLLTCNSTLYVFYERNILFLNKYQKPMNVLF